MRKAREDRMAQSIDFVASGTGVSNGKMGIFEFGVLTGFLFPGRGTGERW